MARLTKEERDAFRKQQYVEMTRWHSHDITTILRCLDDLDAADAEIADDKRLIEGYESVIVAQRKEIARLTTAFEECDKREREAQEALKAMRDENKALKATLVDYRDYGVRADTNPTIAFEVTPTREGTFRLIGFFYDYLRSIDEHVRERARKALGGDAD